MRWIIIGSTAACHWYPDWRQPKDLDLLTPAKISGNHSEFCVVDAQWHDLADELIARSTHKVFADPLLLHTLKVSHAYWDIHWDKTMFDIHMFQQKGAGFDQELHDRLVTMWTSVHGAKKVNMAQTVDTFWNDAVLRRYDHEWLHRQVAFHGAPLHERVRPDLTSTWVSRELFDALPFELQCDLALEEILTTAIERADLMLQSSKSERLSAVKRAHFLLCTSMTKGWFAQFLVQQAFHLRVTLRTRWYQQLNQVLINLSKEQS